MPQVRKTSQQPALTVVVGRPIEYRRAKRLLDIGVHPTFIGRGSVVRWSKNGGLLFFQDADLRQDIAVALVQPRYNCLMALNVIPEYRGCGVGAKIVDFLQCSWVRSIEEKVKYFERLGYVSVGEKKQGRKFVTQIMVKASLMSLAGRLKALDARHTTTHALADKAGAEHVEPLLVKRNQQPADLSSARVQLTRKSDQDDERRNAADR